MLWLIVGIVLLDHRHRRRRDRPSDPVRARDPGAGGLLRRLARARAMTVSDAAGFAVVDLVLGPAAGVAVRGELEIATAPDLTAALDEAIRTTSGPFVHRPRRMSASSDSSGITCLMRARALLGARRPHAGPHLPAGPAPGAC